ncbi:PKD domain-containing protein [Arcticibacter tournemirensis]|uniref:PKD domain-containing protein n=1 Tax=Arcticibacter tournemirensis TaxID=699437 RepID=A0A4Q0MAZ9_9SPHI|nr:PKD domain-containing protein [Arcticibacter tournemirensis]RXF70447.1 PKD domain-containing protein [Arcticibacter tournemirensis]
MNKFWALLFYLISGCLLPGYSQTIAPGNMDGPYGQGSSIAVPVTLNEDTGYFKTDNEFKLYLSDASGSFASETEIGSYTGFYTTFVNGIIPANIGAGNYRVRIKSSNPAITSSPSASFEVKNSAGVKAEIDAPAQQVIGNNSTKAFGSCSPGRTNVRYNFSNTSSAGASVTATFRNEANPSDMQQLSFSSSPQQFTPDITHYTIFVRAELNGVIGTRAYFLINNRINTPFNPPGSSTVCLPLGALEYNVETTSTNGIQLNFPGNTYQVTWGDGSVETFILSQIKSTNGKISHLYTKSSCGSQITIGNVRYYNVFGIVVQTRSQFCGDIGVPISSQAKVISQPENRFTAPLLACVNTPIAITNESIAGEDPSTSSPSCQNNDVVYYWYIDNQLITPQGVPITYTLNHTFTSSGNHTIRLESESTSECQAAPVEKTVYIQVPPKADFELPADTYCLGSIVTPVNKSVVDPNNLAKHDYEWIINGPAPAVFNNNTTKNSKDPQIGFTVEGIYTIKLSISSVCDTVTSAEQTILVNQSPTITANWQANLCGKDQLLTFSNTGGNPVSTSFSGTVKELSDTYSWSVSGGAYSFENGTSASSKEPAILFNDYATYTIVITHKNNCGTVTETRSLTFNESPTISAGSDQTICAGSSAILQGSISGPPVSSFEWKGGTGTFLPGRNALDAQYLPSPAEISAGKAELTLSAVTLNPAPCDKVDDVVIITINPPNKITSAAQKTICTGTAVNYRATASIPGSTISWTASGTANASNFSASGSGDISDIITNSDPDQNAVVTYIVTPESNGCKGEKFTFTVTVSPLPSATVTAANSTICTNQPAGITLSSNLAATKYRWTSTVQGAISGNSRQSTPLATNSINDTLVNAGNTSGTVIYTITPVTGSGCEGAPVTLTITISAPPAIANAGDDEKICNVTRVQLKANNPGSSVGKWTLASGQAGISFDDDTRFDAVANGLVPGTTYRFLWTISGPFNCKPSSDEVTIQILLPVASNTISTTSSEICEGAEYIVNGSTPTGGDNNYSYRWETSINDTDWLPINTATEKDLKAISVESAFFRRIATSGNCSSYSNIVKINVQKGITNNSISADQFICSNNTPAILTGTTPLGADGTYSYQWEKSSDNGATWAVILQATDKDYQPQALSQSSSFRRIVSSAICKGLQQSVSNVITVRVSPGPDAGFTWSSDAACAPFNISAGTITADGSEQGDSFEWFANGQPIGTGQAFPGYNLSAVGDSVEITLKVSSALGCGSATFSHTFKTNASLTANFSTDKISGCGPLNVLFKNTTLNTQGVTFKWDFGNGKFSTLKDPGTTVFDARTDGKDTTYTVTLQAFSNCSNSTKSIEIKVIGRAIALFAPDKTRGCSPLTVTFNNRTQGSTNTYTWDFGDGTELLKTTNTNAVTHTYISNRPRDYVVRLTAENECGKDESTYTIRISPNTVFPDLVVNGNEYEGCAPHTVNFINNTIGATVFTYDFGDGSAPYTTNNTNPVPHTFAAGGKYIIRLTASNGCSDTTTTQTITVNPQAVTDFSANETSGCTSLTVRFINKTTGANSYIWEFGDGARSSDPNPTHTYSYSSSAYRVRLISISPFGCTDTLEIKDYITVSPPPVADFDVLPGDVINIPNYTFTFRDASREDIKKWEWDFGDNGSTSSAPNPDHTYPDTGSYNVRLIVTNAKGCTDTLRKTVRISGIPGSLFVPNAFMPNSATNELRTFKVKGSGIGKWHMRIFNKWGELIWHTEALDSRGEPSESWDGTRNGVTVPQGIYFWEIAATFKNGTEWPGMTYNSSEPKRTGAIHLIR